MSPEHEVLRTMKNRRPRSRNEWLVDAWRDGWREVGGFRMAWARLVVLLTEAWNDAFTEGPR